MRAQRRRFVVEVKRGTSRAAFLSSDGTAEKFGSAEDALFGPREKPSEAAPTAATAATAPASMGRVLRDLQEPPPPPLPDLPQPARRGRKPGSKNKPKPALAIAPDAPAPRITRPLWADAVAAQYASLGAATSEPVHDDASPSEPAQDLSLVTAADASLPIRRSRLRDRSRILKRYVLGTEPAPGQPGWTRGLRSKRRG